MFDRMKLKLKQDREGNLKRLWLNDSEIGLDKTKIIYLNINISDNRKLIELALNLNNLTLDELEGFITLTNPTKESIEKLKQIIKKFEDDNKQKPTKRVLEAKES